MVPAIIPVLHVHFTVRSRFSTLSFTSFTVRTTSQLSDGVDFGSSVTDFRSSVTDFGSSVTDFRSSVTDFGSSVTDFGSSVTDFESSVTDFELYVADSITTTKKCYTKWTAAMLSMKVLCIIQLRATIFVHQSNAISHLILGHLCSTGLSTRCDVVLPSLDPLFVRLAVVLLECLVAKLVTANFTFAAAKCNQVRYNN